MIKKFFERVGREKSTAAPRRCLREKGGIYAWGPYVRKLREGLASIGLRGLGRGFTGKKRVNMRILTRGRALSTKTYY